MAVAFTVAAGGLDAWDTHGHHWAMTHRGGYAAAIAGAVTRSAQFECTLPAVIAVGLLATAGGGWRRVRAAALLGATLSVGLILRLALSDLVGRGRPPQADWIAPAGGYAFPSGHTASAALAAGLVAWTVTRRVRSRSLRSGLWLAAVVYAGAVGWSRVWLGVHWPSDVLGSWLFATGWLTAAGLILGYVDSRRPTQTGPERAGVDVTDAIPRTD